MPHKIQEAPSSVHQTLQGIRPFISHNMKNEIQAISTLISIVEKKSPNSNLDYISESAQALTTMIERAGDYIDVSIESEHLETSSLKKTVEETINRLISEGALKKNQIEVQFIPHINGPKKLLSTIIKEVIKNTIQFKSKERPLKLTISATISKESVIVSIKDNGKGFDPKFKKEIFEIGRTLTHRESPEHIGMGLAIAKLAMDNLKGHIWADTIPEGGTTIHLAFPK